MKKIIYITAIFTTLFTCAFHTLGQTPTESLTMQSSNIATLGRYGDVPVSLYTGIPNINIPIYDIKAGSNVIPITLSYHAAGIMPEQHPGWTGIGWTLFCGGSISRIVNDLPDEYSCESYQSSYKKMGFYYNYNCLNNEEWYTAPFLMSNILGNNQFIKDTQPDKFSFNFNGYSGNFYIDHNGDVKVKCDKNVKVEIKMDSIYVPKDVMGLVMPQTNNTYPFTGFVITTDDGTRYTFGMNDNAVEYSINFWTQHNQEWIATAWHLTQISYSDGEIVNFIYERGNYTYQLGYSISNIATISKSGSGFLTYTSCNTTNTQIADTLSIEGSLISPIYLKQIKFSGGSVNFSSEQTNELRYSEHKMLAVYTYLMTTYPNNSYLSIQTNINSITTPFPQCLNDLQWRKLTAITVNNVFEECIRKFKFAYTDNPNSRLILNGFSEDTQTATPKQYNFEYNNPDSLPPYLSQMVDHWGYYNGKKADTKDPQYFNKRESDSEKMKYGILEKIIYPTGGYTRLEFEANSCTKIVSNNRKNIQTLEKEKIVGGLRIKRIYNSDTGDIEDEILTKEYFYVTDFMTNKENASVSSGVLGCYPKYELTSNKFVMNKDGGFFLLHLFSSQSVLSGGNNALGSHIGYTEVVEKNANGTFTRYRFTNFDTGVMDESSDFQLNIEDSPYEPYSSKEEERGLLTSSETYDSNGRLTNRTSYVYEKDNDSNNNYVRSVKAGAYRNGFQTYAELTAYKIYTYTMRKVKEITETYEKGTTNPYRTIISYKYNNKLLAETSFNGGSCSYVKRYRYPIDFPNNSIYSAMKEKHILSPIIEYQEIYKTDNTEYQQRFDKYDYIYTGRYYLPGKFSTSTKGTPEVRETYTYNQYAKILTCTKDSIDTTVYLWGYNGQYVVAEIKGLSVEEIESVTGDIYDFCSNKIPDFVKLDKLRIKFPHAHIKTCQYNTLVGPKVISNPQGASEYYFYDDAGRLRRVKDNNGKLKALYEYNFKTSEL